MGFLDNLANIATNQASSFEYSSLGAFGKKIDKSAHRQYTVSGVKPNLDPQLLNIWHQTPDITVVIKKKHFSSLIDNYRTDLLNAEERTYIKAIKRLFDNKCQAIAAYERLSKVEKIATNTGMISDYMLPIIFQGIDKLNESNPNLISASTQSILNLLRTIKEYSETNTFTTWIKDNALYNSEQGSGTGIIELTNISSLSTTTSTKFNGGSANFTLEDPYKLSIITRDDIETAISEAIIKGTFPNQEKELNDTIILLQNQLKAFRLVRGAPLIKFIINETTLLSRRIRAIFDTGQEIIFSYNQGFNNGEFSSVDVDQSALEEPNGLNSNELELFKQIIDNCFTLLQLREVNKVKTKEFNKETNFIRQTMMAEFNGKPIIQPMDVVHIYISSKTKFDNKIVQGFNINFGANSILNKLNDAIGSVSSEVDNLVAAFGGSKDSYLETEKNTIAGKDFPLWLWYLVRNQFTKQAAGTHVFAGLVESAPYEFSGGKYTISVNCTDNCKYLNQGQLNVKPSVDVYDSALYDPLTPFKLDFNEGSGLLKGEIPPLLDENVKLLNTGSVKVKSGRFRGASASEDLYKINDGEAVNSGKKIASNLFRRKFNDPDGFVYRWKKGIGSLVWSGQPHSSELQSEAAPNLTKEPFAGQDIMNVLSLLITGQPYNFNNFMKAAIEHGTLNKDDLFNISGSNSFFRGLLSDLSKTNTTWGNFIPFKKLIVNESAYDFLRSGQFDITTANKEVSDLIKERAKRFDELTSAVPEFANNPAYYASISSNTVNTEDLQNISLSSSIAKISEEIVSLDWQIAEKTRAFKESLKNANIRSKDGTLRIIGDDISFDQSLTDDNSLTPQQKTIQRQEFRKRLNTITQRFLWKVKSNNDNNLFIVNDQYDKNYDIQGIEQALDVGLQTYKSTYSLVGEQIESVSKILGLEVFANSQGHIEARPPQYNKIPSSVFFDLILKKQQNGIQIFPAFLEGLFFNQVQGITDRIEIIEDEIRLRSAALGLLTDSDIEKNLQGSTESAGAYAKETKFSFVTSVDGKIGGKDIRNLLMQSNPDLLEDSAKKALTDLNNIINGPYQTSMNFDIVQRLSLVNQEKFNSIDEKISARIEEIRNRLKEKSGYEPLTQQQLLPSNKTISGVISQSDVLDLTSQISEFLSERQYIIKILANAIKNLDQGLEIDRDPDASKNVLFPYLNGNKTSFPEILEHMIEDEDFDDLGEGSGKRYVIKNSQIISFQVEETPPPFTIVEVNGALNTGLVSGPGGLEIGQGGNGIATAFSVDYNMWRQYGFKGYQAVSVPFLQDPEAQCAPYSVFLLNQARQNILKGSVTVIGNEFLQPGEVYYIEDVGLLFYAESVSHSFSYNQSFTSRINLVFGHSPGEFIPTVLDIIGKGLYANNHQANLIRHIRNGNPSGDSNLGILINDSSNQDTSLQQLVANKQGEYNINALANILTAAGSLLQPTRTGPSTNIDLRIYYNKDKGFDSANSTLESIAKSVIDWLKNPTVEVNSSSGQSLLPNTKINPQIDTSKINVVKIDLSKQDEIRSPSSKAWAIARTLEQAASNASNTEDSILENLFSKVIDIWVTTETVSTSDSEQSDTNDDNVSEDQQDKKQEYVDNVNKQVDLFSQQEQKDFNTSQ